MVSSGSSSRQNGEVGNMMWFVCFFVYVSSLFRVNRRTGYLAITITTILVQRRVSWEIFAVRLEWMKIGGGDKSRNPGPRTPFTAYVSHFSCPAVLLLDRPLYVYSYSCCHILVCARCSWCQVVSIHPTSLKHSQQLKNWQRGTHNQQRQSLLFPAGEEAARRLAEDTENSLTPSFSTATTATNHTTGMCGVGVYVWRGRACGQLVFVFTSTEPWIRGGEKDSKWPRSWTPSFKSFFSSVRGFHPWPSSLRNITRISKFSDTKRERDRERFVTL